MIVSIDEIWANLQYKYNLCDECLYFLNYADSQYRIELWELDKVLEINYELKDPVKMTFSSKDDKISFLNEAAKWYISHKSDQFLVDAVRASIMDARFKNTFSDLLSGENITLDDIVPFGDPYDFELLEITPTSDIALIKEAYRNAAKKYHPDRNPTAGSHFDKVKNAYERLLRESVNFSNDDY